MTAEKLPPPLPGNTRIVLVSGTWRNLLPGKIYHILVAKALNVLVRQEVWEILGYLLTKKRVFLVFNKKKEAIPSPKEQLEFEMRRCIQEYFDDQGTSCSPSIYPFPPDPLFTLCSFQDDDLIRLLAGEKVDPGYPDPRLDRLRQMVRHHPYCSVIDYSGAVGPVIVGSYSDRITT